MENIYCPNILNEKIGLKPNEFSKKTSIDNLLLNKLKNKIEGRCIKQGYVKKGSLEILSRSVGKIYDGHFNGEVIYKVKFSVSVCNPPEGMNINCITHNINKMGILAGIGENIKDSPLMVLISRHQNQHKDLFKTLNIGDSINIEIIGKKYELNDNKIHVIGELISKNKTKERKREKKKKFVVKKGGFDQNLDISDKQVIDQRMNIINKYIRIKEDSDSDLSNVINTLKNKINISEWDKLNIDSKNKFIDETIEYHKVEEQVKKKYGSNWGNLTNIDKNNLIKNKLQETNDSEDESLLEI
jgi:DNA-directed RNA polymerase subunit E'/Rpb7